MADQKQLKKFLERRHPDYKRMLAHWDFLEATYEGGRDWFCEDNIFRYIKEGDKEYQDRVKRGYRFNHTREVTDLVQKYIFKSTIVRNKDDAADEVNTFWENATLSGLDINQFMKLVSTATSKLGRIWIVTDSTKKQDVISKADEKKAKARVYAYIVRPQDALDMGFDEEGNLVWILLRERVRDDKDPITATGDVSEQFRLWTQTGWQLFKVQKGPKGRNDFVVTMTEGEHAVGVVPVFSVDHVISDDKYTSPALINDIAYLDRAAANYLSNLDAIIQDQTFSQLVMPAQGVQPGTESYDALIEMGTKRIFTYDGEGGVAPEYISPDAKQAELIITVINKIISEIYNTIGMAGERTKEDNAMGIDNSSGVAKAYDFERMNSLLTSKADALENAENKLVEMVHRWNKSAQPKAELVKYPDTFDVRSLFDEFTIAERLALVEAPDGVRQEQMKQVIDKLFPRIAAELRAKMESELKSWPPQLDLTVTSTVGGTRQPAKFPTSGSKTSGPKPTAQNRQGQVTKNTGK